MSISYLLDTSVLILVLKQDVAILKRMADIQPVYISSIALGELYYGAEHSAHVERSLAEVDGLAKTATILATDKATAEIYGHFKHEQRMKGLMIPDNDLWIASIAIQYGFTLATRDHHFIWIAGLAQEQW
jgi:tRNA(fMet)-specific endonuclease VapC